MNKENNIKGYERLENNFGLALNPPRNFVRKPKLTINKIELTADFIEQVNLLLPNQPWKPGTHKIIADKLKCPIYQIFEAVEILIKNKKRFRQKDGIIYDEDNNIIKIDETRVDLETLKLKQE
jgi:menaquinone-dependent protoporphyrinogen IX oxidase